MPKPIACDRCHRHKERCIYSSYPHICWLCAKVGADCTTLRARARRGRRPQPRNFTNGAAVAVWDPVSLDRETPERSSSDRSVQDDSPVGDLFAEAIYKFVFSGKPWESSPQLVDNFYSCFDCFMLGPTFAAPLRIAAQKAFFCAPTLVQDIYPAIEAAMREARSEMPSPADATVTRGTVSLEKLRTVHINDRQAALGMLALRQVLATFDLLTTSTGSTLILRYALTSAEPWYEELARDPTLDPMTTTSVFWDVVCSLATGERPVLVPRIRYHPSIDRLAGLCTTMIPLLYDLAVAINTINLQREAGQAPDLGPLEQAEHALNAWTPSHTLDFDTAYTTAEKLRMTAQISLHRNGALLFAERVRSPFGAAASDARAHEYASTIFTDFRRYDASLRDAADASSSQGGRGSAGLRHVICPLLAAALEMPDSWTSIADDINLLSIAPACRAQMCGFVDYVRRRRSEGFSGYLYELVRDGPKFAALP